ncbi:hypothetical protein JKF63_01444 [Porcisia hertigi]|uniref:C3H1-type domain-containing protein n=1 Tax=Porcisia hertigi TaxID=2761500 RepID=A0A836HJS1_9TRYP|nr:hypothetical protein JKF63_01444 [Porcisia hertigi]
MYHSVPTPPQQPNMSSIMYVQNAQPEAISYYSTESFINPQPMQQLQPQRMPVLYTTTAAPQRMHGQPQQAIIPESYAPEMTPIYAYQLAPHEAGNKTGNIVCLVPTISSSNPQQFSMLMQSMGSNSSSFHTGPPLSTSEAHTTPQVMGQMLMPEHLQMALETRPPPPHGAMDSAAKAALLASPEVCRHYINGRCNRRKCRFLHPDVNSPTMHSLFPPPPRHTPSTVKSQHIAHVSPLTQYSSLSTTSLSSIHVPAPTPWEIRHY